MTATQPTSSSPASPAAAPAEADANPGSARTLRVVVVQAGLSSPSTTSRLADMFAHELVSEINRRGQRAEMTHIALRPLAVTIMESTVSTMKTQPVADALAAIEATDLLIAVSPTFNASYSGLFKAFFDLVEPKALAGVPVILGATGGTARHSLVVDMAMRPLFTYLRAIPAPTSVFASSDDFAAPSSLVPRARLAAQEALALFGGGGSALANSSDAPAESDGATAATGSGLGALGGRTSAADDFTDFVPFDQLLEQLDQT